MLDFLRNVIIFIVISGPVVHSQIIDPYFCGDEICEAFKGETADSCPGDCPVDPVVTGAWIEAGPYEPIASHGDLWLASWADDGTSDGRVVMTWGDGCGPGVSFGEPACDEWDWDTDIYDAGYFAVDGTFPDVSCIEEGGECFRYPALPDDISGWPHTPDDDKPAGIIALDGVIYVSLGSPQKMVEEGYIATSDDWGHSWNIIPGTPWTMQAPMSPKSPFRIVMFFQMGKNYTYNTDGYVYALGIGWGWYWEFIGQNRVYLCRVPRESVADYNTYQYYSGMMGSNPAWSDDVDLAVPLEGLRLMDTVNVVYHPYLQRFLCLTQFGLFEALNPWGPWIMSSRILNLGDEPEGWGYYSVSLMPKDMGPDSIYAAVSGRDLEASYTMDIVRLHLDVGDFFDRNGLEPRAWKPVPVRHSERMEQFRFRQQPVQQSMDVEMTPMADRHRKIRLFPDSEMTIQQAVDRVADYGEILLAPGVYRGFGNVDVTVTRPIGITGEGAGSECIIDGEGIHSGFLIEPVDDPGVMLKNLTIRNCYRTSPGGAILGRGTRISLDNVKIERCGSFISGGGIGLYESDLTWTGGTAMECFSAMTGGAVTNAWQGHFHCQDVQFIGNTSCLYGGGIYDNETHTWMTDCVFRDCHSKVGGGMRAQLSCTLRLENCFFEENSALVGGGGLCYFISIWHLCDTNSFVCTNCTFRDNMAGGSPYPTLGGGILTNYSPTETIINNSIFWGNSADNGSQFAFNGIGYVEFQHCLLQGGYDETYINGNNWVTWGDGMLSTNPFFMSGPMGDSYLSQISAGDILDSPALDAGGENAGDVTFGIPGSAGFSLDERTTGTHHLPDTGIVDLGAHYPSLDPVPAMQYPIVMLLLVILGILIKRR